MTTSPDWVFGLLLSSGLVALFSGGVWIGFLPGLVTSPPRPEPKRWWSPGGRAKLTTVVAIFASTQYNFRDVWTETPDRYIDATSLVFLALILGGIVAASRRHRATGVWPSLMGAAHPPNGPSLPSQRLTSKAWSPATLSKGMYMFTVASAHTRSTTRVVSRCLTD